MSDLPIPPEPHRFPFPNADTKVGDLHALLADLGIQGVTRQGERTWVTFAAEPPPQVRGEIVRRIKKPK